jgi:hypothetical protein
MKMISAILLSAIWATAVEAQNPLPAGFPKMPGGFDPKTCSNAKVPDPDKIDPMVQFETGKVEWPCDFGKPVPFGKIPTGCAKYEVIVGK